MRITCAAIVSMFAMMGMLSPEMARAAEIIILAGQGVVSAVRDVAPAFERATGHKVVVSFEVGPGLMNKVNSDALADVVTHYPDMIDDLTKKGKVLEGTGIVIARAGIGVAVRAGAPIPDIGSADAFKRSMLAAKSVAYSRAGASGLYAAKLMERLGIADEMKSRIKLVDGVPVAEVVAKGEAEIGMQQNGTSFYPSQASITSARCRRSFWTTSFSRPGCWRFRSSEMRQLQWSNSCPHLKLRHSLEKVAWSPPRTELAIGAEGLKGGSGGNNRSGPEFPVRDGGRRP